jgi:glycerol-3-phosphate O-acyltransferase/dihydroxyacetone phosphate acyltransferase
VKLFGKDVMATYKLIIGFVLVPSVFLLISVVAFFVEGIHTALTVAVCLPLVSYISLQIGREWIMEFRAALPLFLSIISNHKQFSPLYQLRQTLVLQAWSLVAELDPGLSQEVVGFATDRPTREASLFSLRHVSREQVPQRSEPTESQRSGAFIPKVNSLSDLATLAAAPPS